MSSVTRALISVRVQPRARTDGLVALREGVLVVRVTAPPVDGRANDALCRLLSGVLGVRRSGVSVIRGEHSREKLLEVEGVEQAHALATIQAVLERGSR